MEVVNQALSYSLVACSAVSGSLQPPMRHLSLSLPPLSLSLSMCRLSLYVPPLSAASLSLSATTTQLTDSH